MYALVQPSTWQYLCNNSIQENLFLNSGTNHSLQLISDISFPLIISISYWISIETLLISVSRLISPHILRKPLPHQEVQCLLKQRPPRDTVILDSLLMLYLQTLWLAVADWQNEPATVRTQCPRYIHLRAPSLRQPFSPPMVWLLLWVPEVYFWTTSSSSL